MKVARDGMRAFLPAEDENACKQALFNSRGISVGIHA